MTEPNSGPPAKSSPGRAALAWGMGLLFLGVGGARLKAADKEQPVPKRVPVGKNLTAKATMLRREKPQTPWKIVNKKETLYSGDLLVGMPDAQLASRNGAVRLDF